MLRGIYYLYNVVYNNVRKQMGRKKSKKLTVKEGAGRLATLAEKHLSSLPKADRLARLKAFRKVVSRLRESAAKSQGPSETAVSRLAARGRE